MSYIKSHFIYSLYSPPNLFKITLYNVFPGFKFSIKYINNNHNN